VMLAPAEEVQAEAEVVADLAAGAGVRRVALAEQKDKAATAKKALLNKFVERKVCCSVCSAYHGDGSCVRPHQMRLYLLSMGHPY
jgi:hypothetical protein